MRENQVRGAFRDDQTGPMQCFFLPSFSFVSGWLVTVGLSTQPKDDHETLPFTPLYWLFNGLRFCRFGNRRIWLQLCTGGTMATQSQARIPTNRSRDEGAPDQVGRWLLRGLCNGQ